jgi:very-short-patch-repair endonuclease
MLAVIAALVILAAVIGKASRRKNIGLDVPWPLEARRALLTEPEQVLYRRLVQALPDQLVFAQVQLLQAVRFKRGARKAAVFNRISQLSLDFVVLAPDTRILAAVELDDASHDDRQSADARKEHALKSEGIPLIRWLSAIYPTSVRSDLRLRTWLQRRDGLLNLEDLFAVAMHRHCPADVAVVPRGTTRGLKDAHRPLHDSKLHTGPQAKSLISKLSTQPLLASKSVPWCRGELDIMARYEQAGVED